MKQAVIQCRGIKKTYGTGETQVEALKTTDLDIFPQELTLLVGPSGSGKTTLISILSTILMADEGELILLGKKINGLTEDEKAEFRLMHLGMVFQSLFLIPTLTVLENVSLPLMVAGCSAEEANEKAFGLLKEMRLDHRCAASPALLSKGQQQRVAIARAMINKSSIIVCDEPTSALDHVTGFEIMEFLHALAADPLKAILVVTHDPRIFPYADRMITMSDGQIISSETLSEHL